MYVVGHGSVLASKRRQEAGDPSWDLCQEQTILDGGGSNDGVHKEISVEKCHLGADTDMTTPNNNTEIT